MVTRLMIRLVLALCCAWLSAGLAYAELSVRVDYVRLQAAQPPTLSNLDVPPADLGLAGAQLGQQDNQTTAGFLGHDYQLTITDLPPGSDIGAAVSQLAGTGGLVIVDASAQQIVQMADLMPGSLILNAADPQNDLRGANCRPNLLHTIPSNAMRADALAQFLTMKRWTDAVLIAGTHPQDQAFAQALKTSLAKFQLRLRGEKIWEFDADMRRNAAQEVPLFTQDFKDHDVLLVADEINDFARYIPYNTWSARPVAGSEGAVPLAWSPAVEQWGAAQLQSRFAELAGRGMQARDYGAWAAMRAIGEAVTRTNSADPATLRAYMLSDGFELAGFKGRPQSFRGWNGQMRQPIPLLTPRAVVATAPLPGFLHPTSELDTLGVDQPETTCTAFTR